MTGESFVDHVALAVAARQQSRSLRRFTDLLRRSLRLAWRADRRLFSTNAGLQLVGGAVAALQVLATQAVLSAILSAQQNTGAIRAAVWPVLALAAVLALTTVASAVQQQLQRLLGELVGQATWDAILDVATTVRLRAFESPQFFDRLQRVQSNALHRPFTLSQGLVGLVGGLAGSLGLALAVVSLHPVLLPLLLLSGIPMFWSTRRASHLEFRFAVDQVPRLRMRDYLAQVQTGREEAKEVRAFGLARALRARYDRVYDAYLAELRQHVRRRTVLALIASLASSALLALTLLALIWLVAQRQVSLAAAGAAIVAVRLLSQQLVAVFSSAQQIFESGLFMDDLDQFIATAPPPGPPPVANSAVANFEQIDVSGLCFTYPGSQTPALSDITMQLRRGQVVALVGENGSGKTTLAKLLATLYEPDEGRIAWDGHEVTPDDAGQLRRSIAVIFQDFVRYQLPASDNIAFGDVDREDDDVAMRAAAERAGVDQLLRSLPHGYDTILSKAFAGGRELSLGQWQRVALARAFFRDAPLVILDEPSASLDPRAEHALFASLRRVLAGRTVLYVSHRMSTVREADCIFVLHEGRLVERGTHDELMAASGRYFELFTLQAAGYRDPAAG